MEDLKNRENVPWLGEFCHMCDVEARTGMSYFGNTTGKQGLFYDAFA